MKLNRVSILFPGLLAIVLMAACASSVKKGDIADSANPRDEIARLGTALDEARANDVDVLATTEFKKADKAREDAKDKLADGKKQEQILEELRVSQGYLNEATALAGKRRANLPGLFDARHAAIAAGGLKQPDLRKDFEAADEKVSDKSEDLMALDASKIAAIQQNYVDLERRATVLTQLGTAMAKVNGAVKDDAAKKAPNSLKLAQVDVKNAESVISTNVRNPSAFQDAVVKANNSANFLAEVMTTINQNGKKLPESAAVKMVNQNKKISGLQSEVASVEATQSETQARLRATTGALNSTTSALSSAEQSVAMQKAIEQARKEFSANEAEAYQQGDKLIVRLKNIKFASGRSEVPSESMALLAKVADVAKTLNADDIKVEGHTDSVGTKEVNEKLSTSRAESVASFFKTNGFNQVESEGYGFSKPLASNKTKEGRAQNRRVDIVIAPAKTAVQ